MRKLLTRLLVAAALAVPGLAVTAMPAHAVGCYGADCDNLGPKGNGCFDDDVNRASGGGTLVYLRYSKACHAFWTYEPWDPDMWDTEMHLEMEKLVDGNWTFVRRLVSVHEANGTGNTPDWTNMLGARTTAFRFRGIHHDPFGGGDFYTPWVRGGAQS